jgi:hypothetical protein
MTEGIFVLIVIYAAYAFFNKKKASVKFTTPTAEPEKKSAAEEGSSFEQPPQKQPVNTVDITIIEQPVPIKQTTQKKALKNPMTGDIANTYTNYRFTKRWIKEALVTEGLLEKVYKNNELNAEIEATIKIAIAKLETIEQYKV